MISILDYGLGNVKAIKKVYDNLNVPSKIASEAKQLKDSEKFILPGVGSFDFAMNQFNNTDMVPIIEDEVLNKKKPILGICVGMQMMTKSSEEGVLPGLGWLNAKIVKFKESAKINLFPHMGWNNIIVNSDNKIFKNLNSKSYFYFLHSYYLKPKDEVLSIAKADYSLNFTCAVMSDNIFGVQFHPEKSHENGITLLKNFSDL